MFWLVLAPLIALATYLADTEVHHGAWLWTLTAITVLLLRAITVGRLSWFFIFMAIFFALGCWLKIVVHHIFDYPYIEPTGNFSDSPEEWDDYYLFASTIGLSLLGARITSNILSGIFPKPTRWLQLSGPVGNGEWLALILIAGCFYFVNNQLAFFVTGVDAKITLPFALNAPLAFMALIGFAVVTSTFLERDVVASRTLTTKAILSLLTVSAIASISMASRAAIVMQAIPILLAAAYVTKQITGQRPSLKSFVYFTLFLVTVLVIVSIYRIQVFSGSSLANQELVFFFALESAMLVVDRWVGAEALMVAVSEPTRSLTLFTQILAEDAARGSDAIYQILAGSKYGFLQGLTFLTLPGYFAVLGLSGSMIAIAAGTFFITLAGIAYESLARRALFGKTISAALISAALANALTQLSFPRLLIPFIFQMTALIILLSIIYRSQYRPLK